MAFKNEKYDELSHISNDISTNKIFLPSKNLKYPNKFTVSQETLVSIVSACQERTFAEEVDILESYGSMFFRFFFKLANKIAEKFFENALGTNFETGIPGNAEDLRQREEEYSHNRKPPYKTKSNNFFIWNFRWLFI